eukprot:216267_1
MSTMKIKLIVDKSDTVIVMHNVPKSNAYKHVLQFIRDKMNIKAETLKYVDQENDKVQILSDDDIRDAIETAQQRNELCKIYVKPVAIISTAQPTTSKKPKYIPHIKRLISINSCFQTKTLTKIFITLFIIWIIGCLLWLDLIEFIYSDIGLEQNTIYFQRVNVGNISEIPENAMDLNSQMLCPIHQNMSSQQILLDIIYKNQFEYAQNNDRKYLIFEFSKVARGGGLTYLMFSWLSLMFAWSIRINRTYLLTGIYDMMYEQSYCKQYDAMECVFKPLSNINSIDLLSNITNNSLSIVNGTPFKMYNLCIIENCDEFDIIHINARNWSNANDLIWFREIAEPWLLQMRNSNMLKDINNNHYQIILISFIMRLKHNVYNIIMNKLAYNLNILKTKPKDTIVSMPIRASDKCGLDMYLKETSTQLQIKKDSNLKYLMKLFNGTHSTVKYDPNRENNDCWTPHEIYLLVLAMKNLSNSKIDTIIITSEDIVFIKILKSYLKYDENNKWNIIENKKDYTFGEGTVAYTHKLKNKTLNDYINITMSKHLGT